MEIKTNAKIRVRLESFNNELLISSCQKKAFKMKKYSLRRQEFEEYIADRSNYLLPTKM